MGYGIILISISEQVKDNFASDDRCTTNEVISEQAAILN